MELPHFAGEQMEAEKQRLVHSEEVAKARFTPRSNRLLRSKTLNEQMDGGPRAGVLCSPDAP